MATITINGTVCEFAAGERILDIANRCGVEIPQYCYHPGLSIPAQCRICLAEIWAPNPRNDNKVEPMMGGKLQPTCSTVASDGMVVYANSPKAIANQKAVMEYLLINHPLDCPVCDQAGECSLQDYSYKYGRGVSRFEDQKVKQPKKDLGPNVYIYSDRCILCTRCVRFTREVPATGELMIDGRGNRSEIDVFPGVPLGNEMSANVVDLCPVGALLDKDFLFAQRVWLLKSTPTIDGLTSSGDNVWADHNEGKVYRFRPRENKDVNTWWITDEVRYSWKHVHSDARLTEPLRREHGVLVQTDWQRAIDQALEGTRQRVSEHQRLAVLVSPMLSCEEAYALAKLARTLDDQAVLAIGPVPFGGEDKSFHNPGAGRPFVMRAEKAPNARGVKRVLDAFGGTVLGFGAFLDRLGRGTGRSDIGAVLVTGNYPSTWATGDLLGSLGGKHVTVCDTLASDLADAADVVLPACSWLEKAGTFENVDHRIQAFERAIPPVGESKPEGQIALDMLAVLAGADLDRPRATYATMIVDEGPGQVPAATASVVVPLTEPFDAKAVRREMAAANPSLRVFVTDVATPPAEPKKQPDAPIVEL
ncbi:MAG: molybdopterin-dependent oxidoreductase [Phycisphaerales bacterium]